MLNTVMIVFFYNNCPIQLNTHNNVCKHTVYSIGMHFAWGFAPLKRDKELSFEYILFGGLLV